MVVMAPFVVKKLIRFCNQDDRVHAIDGTMILELDHLVLHSLY